MSSALCKGIEASYIRPVGMADYGDKRRSE
jgi:hypothetical protein